MRVYVVCVGMFVSAHTGVPLIHMNNLFFAICIDDPFTHLPVHAEEMHSHHHIINSHIVGCATGWAAPWSLRLHLKVRRVQGAGARSARPDVGGRQRLKVHQIGGGGPRVVVHRAGEGGVYIPSLGQGWGLRREWQEEGGGLWRLVSAPSRV